MSDKSALKYVEPTGIAAPFANYSHGVLVRAGSDMVFCSGQLGVAIDAPIPDSIEEQTELCYANIKAILEASGMTMQDVVRINAFVTDRDYIPGYMAVRDRVFAKPAPASTLIIVTGFTRAVFKVEIEAIAARRS